MCEQHEPHKIWHLALVRSLFGLYSAVFGLIVYSQLTQHMSFWVAYLVTMVLYLPTALPASYLIARLLIR